MGRRRKQKLHVRNDGRTAYEDMAKHRVKHTVVASANMCNWRLPRTSKTKTNTMGEWDEGYVVGVASRSSEYLVVKGNHIFECPTIRRKVDEDTWNVKCMEDIKAIYFGFVKNGGQDHAD